MPNSRQDEADEASRLIVRALGVRYCHGYEIPPHEHRWGQLIFASEGVMTVAVPEGAWVVPTRRAVWVPPGTEHSIRMSGPVHMRTLYLRPDWTTALPPSCRVLQVAPLLRELILHIVTNGPLDESKALHVHLAHVLVGQLVERREIAVDLRLPTDARARSVADRILEDLRHTPTLPDLARDAGASPRTIERLFQRETDQTFGQWRQQARLLEALRQLAQGASVAMAARAVGYESTSAFIVMFRRAFGTTPGRYYQSKGLSANKEDVRFVSSRAAQ